jgi:hypothetical protein
VAARASSESTTPPKQSDWPDPPPTGMIRHHRRKSSGRVWWVLSGLCVLMLVVCGVTSFFTYRVGTQGPKTPQLAVDMLMRSVKKRSINEFESSLCAEKRNQAGPLLRQFNDGMVDFNQELTDLRWKTTKTTTPRKATKELTLDVTFTAVSRDQGVVKRERSDFPVRMQTVEKNGWYVCQITILTL